MNSKSHSLLLGIAFCGWQVVSNLMTLRHNWLTFASITNDHVSDFLLSFCVYVCVCVNTSEVLSFKCTANLQKCLKHYFMSSRGFPSQYVSTT